MNLTRNYGNRDKKDHMTLGKTRKKQKKETKNFFFAPALTAHASVSLLYVNALIPSIKFTNNNFK